MTSTKTPPSAGEFLFFSLYHQIIMKNKKLWNIITFVEIIAVAAVIVFDLFIPTIVILGMIVVSLLIRRERITSLGFKKSDSGLQMAGVILLNVVVWQLFQIGFIMPV